MVFPQGPLSAVPGLTVATSTLEDGHMGRSRRPGDQEAARRRRFASSLGIDPDQLAILEPDGNGVLLFDRPSAGLSAEAAVFTAPASVGLLTADCVPLVLCDPTSRRAALAHVGWRQLAGGVVERTVDSLSLEGSPAACLLAYLGPSISKESYRHGWLKRKFKTRRLGKLASFMSADGRLDLKGAINAVLIEKGLQPGNIETSPLCTYKESGLLPSHRREGGRRRDSVITVVSYSI